MAKQKTATIKQADPNSKRSKRRKTRGFKSLEVSCRKHRRAARRSAVSRTQYGRLHEPGTKADGGSGTFVHNAGGSIRFW